MKPNHIAITLLSIALLISIALNFILFKRGEQYYLQLNATRLDPVGLSFYPQGTDQHSNSTTQKRVVFFGDSRASNWTFPAGLNQFQFVNRGIGAQTSAQVLERFDDHIVPLQPQVIIVQVGINDLKTIPIFPDQKASIIANCQANLERIVSQSLDLGAIVILTTIFPLGEVPLERKLFWSADVAEAIEEVNAFIYSLERENVIVFDTTPILANEKGVVRPEYSRDLLHLTDAGYDALNEELVRILATLEPYPLH